MILLVDRISDIRPIYYTVDMDILLHELSAAYICCQPITIYAMLNSGTRDSVFILNLTILFQALLLASHVHQMLTAQLRPVTKVKSLSVMAVHVTVTM